MSPLSVFEATRLDLARLTAQGHQHFQRGLLQAAQASARALQVARVGVWFLSPDGSQLVLACQAGPDGPVHLEQAPLRLEQMPLYVGALLNRRVVMAHDAVHTPETSELAAHYLIPRGISSMLDAPVFRQGEVVGVVCHEHVGQTRTWTPRERDFAASVAEVIEVLLEQASRIENEEALKAQQARTERLERSALLARFAAGIAHDFNNILATILLQVEMMRGKATDELKDDLDGVVNFIDAGKLIVTQLLTYSKESPFVPRALLWSRILQSQQRLLNVAVGSAHQLSFHLSDERAAVHGDAAQLNQMLLNLVLNARDAMPDGGEISVSLEVDPEWVTLSVQDRGVGIDESLKARIFEPFFTTKGTGTGLGLSTVQSIVQRHDGLLDVESAPGQGARFSVRLPRIEA